MRDVVLRVHLLLVKIVVSVFRFNHVGSLVVIWCLFDKVYPVSVEIEVLFVVRQMDWLSLEY